MEAACSSRVSVSVNKTTRCHNTEAHNVLSKILASLSLIEDLSLPISFQHLFPIHTCASDLQVNPTRKQTDIAVLPRCIAVPSPPPCHPTCLQTRRFIIRIITVASPVFANGCMLQNKHFREERHKERYSSTSCLPKWCSLFQ
jgi:hypothetical protein